MISRFAATFTCVTHTYYREEIMLTSCHTYHPELMSRLMPEAHKHIDQSQHAWNIGSAE